MASVEVYCKYAERECEHLDKSIYTDIELRVCVGDTPGQRYIVDGGTPGYGPVVIVAPSWCKKRKIIQEPTIKDKMGEKYWMLKK